MSTARPSPPKLLDLDVTVVSAKDLKNVNWRHGDLKPYVVFWVDSVRRLSTKSDDSGSTKPTWNEHFVVPITVPLQDALLSLEIFHSKPSETSKPLVGTLRLVLNDLVDSDDSSLLRTFELRRPSGRPQGKIRLKIALRERPPPQVPDYHNAPLHSFYYSSAPPPPVRDYRAYSAASLPPMPLTSQPPQPYTYPYVPYAGDHYSGCYPGYFTQPPPPPRPFFERQSSYGGPSAPVDQPPPPRPFFERQSSYGGPSAPVDYTAYDQKQKAVNVGGYGAAMGVGAVAGGIAGLSLDEALKQEEDKILERSESDFTTTTRDDYSDYRFNHDYK